jgi:hypothetical protein
MVLFPGKSNDSWRGLVPTFDTYTTKIRYTGRIDAGAIKIECKEVKKRGQQRKDDRVEGAEKEHQSKGAVEKEGSRR